MRTDPNKVDALKSAEYNAQMWFKKCAALDDKMNVAKQEVSYLTAELAATADELAYWKYQACYWRANYFKRGKATDDNVNESRIELEKGYPDHERKPY